MSPLHSDSPPLYGSMAPLDTSLALRSDTTSSSQENSPTPFSAKSEHLFLDKRRSGLSNTNTPVNRMISSSRVSSGVNHDSVYNTPTRCRGQYQQPSPSRSSVRSNRMTRHKHLFHNRKLRAQPSKLDMLDSGFTSFPMRPPDIDNENVIAQNNLTASMVLIEDYIEENKRFLSHRNNNKSKKMSVLDFKKILRDQTESQTTGSPSLSAFSNSTLSILQKRDVTEGASTIKSQFSVSGQWAFVPTSSTFSSFGSRAKEDSFTTTSSSNTLEGDDVNIFDASEKRCVICEIKLHEIPKNSCFKELVCFNCTEQYEHIVNLINNNNIDNYANIHSDTEEALGGNDNDTYSLAVSTLEDYENARQMSLTPIYDQPSAKKQCSTLDNIYTDQPDDLSSVLTNSDNFAKLYLSLKKIQERDNRAIAQTEHKKRFHNPFIKVPVSGSTTSQTATARNGSIFNLNETPSFWKLPPPPTSSSAHAARPMFSIDNLREAFEKFKKLTINDNRENNLGDDVWIRTKRKLNMHRQIDMAENANIDDDNESYMRWT